MDLVQYAAGFPSAQAILLDAFVDGYGGGGKVFVQAGLKANVVFTKKLAFARHLLIDTAKRRTAITGDIAGGVQTGGAVAGLLHEHEAHQRLCAVQQNRRFGQVETIFEADILTAHPVLPDNLRVLHYRSKMLTHKDNLSNLLHISLWHPTSFKV
mgnify:CR=1 FL=1